MALRANSPCLQGQEAWGARPTTPPFNDEAGREAHLNGEIAKALMARADELLREPPKIHKIQVIAVK